MASVPPPGVPGQRFRTALSHLVNAETSTGKDNSQPFVTQAKPFSWKSRPKWTAVVWSISARPVSGPYAPSVSIGPTPIRLLNPSAKPSRRAARKSTVQPSRFTQSMRVTRPALRPAH
jgi:hypothetical protein